MRARVCPGVLGMRPKYNISACFHIGNCSLAQAAVTFIIIRAVLRGAKSFWAGVFPHWKLQARLGGRIISILRTVLKGATSLLGMSASALEIAVSLRRSSHFHYSGSSRRRDSAGGLRRFQALPHWKLHFRSCGRDICTIRAVLQDAKSL